MFILWFLVLAFLIKIKLKQKLKFSFRLRFPTYIRNFSCFFFTLLFFCTQNLMWYVVLVDVGAWMWMWMFSLLYIMPYAYAFWLLCVSMSVLVVKLHFRIVTKPFARVLAFATTLALYQDTRPISQRRMTSHQAYK